MNKKIEINIKNFKAILDANVSVHSNNPNKLMAIIGDNNSGKSSFLDALKKLAGNPNTNPEEFTTFFNPKNGKTEVTNIHPQIGIKFNFFASSKNTKIESYIENNNFSKPYFKKDWIEQRKEIIDAKIEKLENDADFERTGAFILNPETFSNEFFFSSFLHRISTYGVNRKLSEQALEIKELFNYKKMESQINLCDIKNINIFKYNSLRLELLFNDQNADQNDFDEIRTIRIWENILKIDFKNFLLEKSTEKDKSNKDAMINKFRKDANKLLEDISKSIFGELTNEKLKMWFESEDSTLNIKWEKQSQKNRIVLNNKIKQTGDGIKHFWSIIFRIHSIKKEEPSIILLDEPEKHLNPIQQNYLLKYFKKITSKGARRENQVLIYTTHSPFMIDLDIYDNIYELYRDKETNGIQTRKIYETKLEDSPNLLFDKNLQLRFAESLYLANRPKRVIFVEGITDFYVLSNLLRNSDIKIALIIPMFGNEFKKSLSYHLPYISSYIKDKNIKVILDNDKRGKEIAQWIKTNTNIIDSNIKTYGYFFEGSDLESAIIKSWFSKNAKDGEIKMTANKKVNAIIFNKNNKEIELYKKLIDFIIL